MKNINIQYDSTYFIDTNIWLENKNGFYSGLERVFEKIALAVWNSYIGR